ncbi:MAG: hypothetical protein HY670_04635 [Chloroflexi bacterium]|nr:hypothetical protein [Chloroflexota bacterium]
MKEIPPIVKILKYVLAASGPVRYDHISSALQEGQGTIAAAADRLVADGILERDADYLRLCQTPAAEEFCRKLCTVFDKLIEERARSIVRGILSGLGPGRFLKVSLLRYVINKEGSSPAALRDLLDSELGVGHVRLVKALAVSELAPVLPADMPDYYLSHFHQVSPEQFEAVKRRELKAGMSILECHYVAGTYPPELAEEHKRYMAEEKPEIMSWVSMEVSRQLRALGNNPKCYWYFLKTAEILE